MDSAWRGQLESAVRVGNLAALVEALLAYAERDVPTPFWVLRRARTAIVHLLSKTRERGAFANPWARLKQDAVHAIRYDLVVEIREKQPELAEDVADLKDVLRQPHTSAAKERAREREAYRDAVGKSWRAAYACASRMLEGTPAWGSAHAMEGSHRLVGAHGHRGSFYRLRLPQVQAALGLDRLDRAKPGTPGFEERLLGKEARAKLRRPVRRSIDGLPQCASPKRPVVMDPKASSPAGTKAPIVSSGPGETQALVPDVLDGLRASVEAGNLVALWNGLAVAAQRDRRAPPWLLMAAARRIVQLIRDAPDTPGRRKDPLKLLRARLTHIHRHGTVEYVRWHQRMAAADWHAFQKIDHPDDGAWVAAARERHLHLGTSLSAAVRHAAWLLRLSPCKGNPAAIKKSHALVEETPTLRLDDVGVGPDLARELGLPGVFSDGLPSGEAAAYLGGGAAAWPDDDEALDDTALDQAADEARAVAHHARVAAIATALLEFIDQEAA